MRRLFLIALAFSCMAGPAHAQDRAALIKGLENILVARAIDVKCKNLQAIVSASLKRQETSFARAGKVAPETLSAMRANAVALVANQDCTSPFVTGYRNRIVGRFALENNINALALHGKCNLFDAKIVEALTAEMTSNARRSATGPEDLQVMQRRAADGVAGMDCRAADVQRAAAQVRQAHGTDGLSPGEQPRAEFALLIAAQEGNRKCTFLTQRQLDAVNQEVRRRAPILEFEPQAIHLIRRRVAGQVSQQRCDGPELSAVKRWVACGLKTC